MSVIPEPDRSKLYTQVKHLLGAPLRSVEIVDEQMDHSLKSRIGKEHLKHFVFQRWKTE